MKEKEALRVAFQVFSEIAIIGRLADTALGKNLPEELSVAGFGVLNHFARLNVEGENPARLARAFQVTKGAMTYTLQRLEALKYVRIEPDRTDGRGKVVRVTKAGERAREAAIARIDPAMRGLIQVVSADEFSAALRFLIKLRQAVDARR